MGFISDALRIRNAVSSPPSFQPWISGGMNVQPNYESYARSGYAGNEIVFSAIELLATSAAEPHIAGRRKRRASPTRNELLQKGIQRPNAWLVQNAFVEELPNHPLVQMLNKPNPFMSRGQMWGTVVMDRALAGNAYLLKVRSELAPLPLELWRLRPDKVKIIPSPTNFIEAFEYRNGQDVTRYDPKDIIHFKTRNPLPGGEYYGMPPMMPLAGRVDIDNYMKSFLKTFFERGGTGPGAVLSVKQKLLPEQKDEIRERAKKQFGGNSGFHEWLILDNAESTYTPLGLNRGMRDALPNEINAMQEARIAMVFGIPGSILGLLIGYESSSYANKRQDWQVLWDVTMTPLLSDLDDVLNLSLVPEFSGIDEVYFDLDDIKALQEDVDKIQDRERKNFIAGGLSFEEFRESIGRDPNVTDGTFFVPANTDPTPFERLGEEPEPQPVQIPEAPEDIVARLRAPASDDYHPSHAVVAEPRCPKCNRRNGANIQVGGSITCQRCREDFVVVDRNQNGH